MRLVVIGASNSIIGENGYISALRQTHEVTNLSAGDVPIFFTLSKILTRQEDIAQADFVILDHSISDRISYFPKLRGVYADKIQGIYRILLSINPNVISVVFPLKLISKAHDEYLDAMADICRRQNVHFVNFQPIATDDNFFEDVAHVHCEVSYLMGLSLSEFILGLQPRPRIEAEIADHGYIVREARFVSPDQPVFRFQSSFAQADYIVIDPTVTLEFEHPHQAVYIEYVVLRDDPKWMAMDVNGAAHYYGGLDITGDLIAGEASTQFVLSSIKDERELRLNHSRGAAISTDYCPVNMVRMIFKADDCDFEHPHIPVCEMQEFDITTLITQLETLGQSGWFEQVQNLSEQSAEIIRLFGLKGMVNHKRYFAETIKNGNKVRKIRMDKFWRSNQLGFSGAH